MFGTICYCSEGSVQLIKSTLQLKKMLLFLVLVVAEVQFSPVQLWRSFGGAASSCAGCSLDRP